MTVLFKLQDINHFLSGKSCQLNHFLYSFVLFSKTFSSGETAWSHISIHEFQFVLWMKCQHIKKGNYNCSGKVILTAIKYINIYRRCIWRINNISIFAKFILCNFIYCIPLVSCIRNSFIYWIWEKMKCTFVSSPDDCFHMITSRSNNIYISIILLSEARVISFIQCYNQGCVVWNCCWHDNIDSLAS